MQIEDFGTSQFDMEQLKHHSLTNALSVDVFCTCIALGGYPAFIAETSFQFAYVASQSCHQL